MSAGFLPLTLRSENFLAIGGQDEREAEVEARGDPVVFLHKVIQVAASQTTTSADASKYEPVWSLWPAVVKAYGPDFAKKVLTAPLYLHWAGGGG